MKYIIAIGIFQALAAAVLLWRSRVRNQADGLLIALLTCIGIHLSIKFFIYTVVTDFEVLNMMNTFIGFCYLPLLYLYTIKTIRPNFIPASQWYVFVPFAIGTIAFFSVLSVLITSLEAGHNILYWYNTISLWTLIPLDVILACWIIYYANKNLDKQSNEKKLITQIAYLFLITSILSITFILLKPFGFTYNYIARSIIYTFLIVICIRIITYRYSAAIYVQKENLELNPMVADIPNYHPIRQIDNFNQQSTNAMSLAETGKEPESKVIPMLSSLIFPEKRRELLSMDEMMSILLKLETAMTTQGYYKDSELTLDKLATLTKHNKYHISETLNHFLHKPFYTFVNEYRIQHVKDRIECLSKKDIEINMLTLAYDAGFNSKSSFNRYFKEIVGLTPTAYFKTIAQEIEMAL
ncbi:helix-turn-helix domain-containing protein [Pedobacter frigiditerrae]|uniref:Helix-turn-helix domain-containing protein n=1 Tax=Pedobacter frigiditerrae TaxID=2530452 RepID=A0A4R0MSZ5_9SPHI|nr:helix-turn-helix domain-containing protein [Pedobacter frigiditerrae]TCC90135.1 helix-turn-helix domain-containing protein [Pedobacter frigiditerrae]